MDIVFVMNAPEHTVFFISGDIVSCIYGVNVLLCLKYNLRIHISGSCQSGEHHTDQPKCQSQRYDPKADRAIDIGSVAFLFLHSSALQFVAGFDDCFDLLRRSAQFIPQTADMGVHCPGFAFIIIAPALYQKLLPGQNRILVSHQAQ